MFRIIEGDCLATLPTLPEKHFHCCVTSPPYFGLRSYLKKEDGAKSLEVGLEQTPAAYVEKMVAVARGVRRVLRDDGTFWLNIGDSYNNAGTRNNGTGLDGKRRGGMESSDGTWESAKASVGDKRRILQSAGVAMKSLCLIPQRLLLALSDDGWVVRSVIRWFKVSPMPESTRDRPTSAVEEIFLLTKQSAYYYDQDAERVPHARLWDEKNGRGIYGGNPCPEQKQNTQTVLPSPGGRNLWNWWEVTEDGSGSWFMSNEPYKGGHYACFPSKLPERCIRLGTSEKGCCGKCGEPYRRITERSKKKRERPNDYTKRAHQEGTGNACANSVSGVEVNTLGWEVSCECNAEVAPCRILDPFCGAATTLLAATRLGRESVGLELNASYVKLGEDRVLESQPGPLPDTNGKPKKEQPCPLFDGLEDA